MSRDRAGYLPGLARYFDEPIEAAAYYVLVDEGDGYETSNAFAQFTDDQDEPVRFFVPEEYREPLDHILSDLLSASADGRVILVFEENGHVTSPDLTEEEMETIDVVGLVSNSAFWRLADLGQILEDSVIVIKDGRTGDELCQKGR